MGVYENKEVSKNERKYQKFQIMKEVKSKQYMTPVIKVVAFRVEDGFGSLTQGTSSVVNTITFGGDRDHGLMNHGTGDHSGLGAYEEGGNIFGGTIGSN